MKLVIFGATGTIGVHLVQQALATGHEVTAFTRGDGAKLSKHPSLVIARGDVHDRDAVANAVTGQDAVLIALGAGAKGGVRAPATQNIVDAMHEAKVSRLICLSTLGVGDSARFLNFFWKYLMFGMLLKAAFRDHEQQEAIVRQSDLDWTIVRPAAYTDGPHSAFVYLGSLAGAKNLRLKIPRVDVARFLLNQTSDQSYLHQSPALSC